MKHWANVSIVATTLSSLILIFTYFSGALTFPDFLQKYRPSAIQSARSGTLPEGGANTTTARVDNSVSAAAPASGTSALPASPDEMCRQFTSTQYCVSSVLAPQGDITYGPERLFDSDPDTAWQPNTLKSADGLGEWILLRFARPRSVGSIVIANGYQKQDKDIYYKNDRPHEIDITQSNGRTQSVFLDDRIGVQRIALVGADDISWVRFTIRSVYPGTKYHDVGISDIGAE